MHGQTKIKYLMLLRRAPEIKELKTNSNIGSLRLSNCTSGKAM